MSDGARIEIQREPYNAETPMGALAEPLTPPGLFYVRTHFDIPDIDAGSWSLDVSGSVDRPLRLSLADLQSMPSLTVAVTLECAGNGRASLSPPPPGTPWRLGAVGTAEFTGVPLRAILEEAGPRDGAVEVVSRGADRGPVDGGRTAAYERGLPLREALEPGPLLAWGMHGRDLSPAHGHPVRLVVPGWYAMASVKWLTELRVVEEPFRGFYQEERYVYVGGKGAPEREPVTRMRPRAVIARPANGAVLPAGPVEMAGTAWSGSGPVSRVEVSVDGGASWSEATMGSATSPHAATPWRFLWNATPGEREVVVRATDGAGDVQPLDDRYNRLGYGNNAAQRVRVRVRGEG